MDLVENSAEAKRREKSDFSVSSIIGLKDSSKRTSTDERDSIGKKNNLLCLYCNQFISRRPFHAYLGGMQKVCT